jgi:glucosamine--fructose-6-phosphate aminotransferase (isomerizing)
LYFAPHLQPSEPIVKRPSPKRPRESRKTESRAAALKPTPGQHTIREILSQPAMWAETDANLASEGTLDRLATQFTANEPWLFVACGSSYYLAQLVSAIWSRNFSLQCAVVPASEFLFAPEEVLRSTGATQVVFVSRSGETTEVIRAAEILQRRSDIRSLGVTCNAASPFEALCTRTFTLPWADEKSTVMTRSFTSMLLAFQRLGARLRGDRALPAALDQLPQLAQPWLDLNADKIRKFASKRRFADFVFLGQGAHYWLAQEAALKVTEMSASYAQAYHTLEFRHGPRSIAGPDTLITFFISDAAQAEESLLVRELKALRAVNLVIVNRATAELKAASDLLVELNLGGPEFARFAVAAIPAHILGTAAGLRKSLDPDSPKNLTRAVVLGNSSATSKIAARPKNKLSSAGPAGSRIEALTRKAGARV